MSTDAQVRLAATVVGRVQGVGFRDYTAQAAQRLGLVGWVANRRDGSVQIIAEGPESIIQAFIEQLKLGPAHANVDQIIEDRFRATGEYSNFRIQYL